MILGLSGGAPYVRPTVPMSFYQPNNSNIDYSDYAFLSLNGARARFYRPTDVFGNGNEYANPGARVRIATLSRYLSLRIQYSDLISRSAAYAGAGALVVDGALHSTFDRAQGAAGPVTLDLDLGSTSARLIEILMPYAASVDFLGVSIASTASLVMPGARPSIRYVAVGDSITQGFNTTNSFASWTQQLAIAKGWQCIDIGYGGHQCLPNDVANAAALSPDVGTYMIGTNDYLNQASLASFKANIKTAVMNWRSIAPSAKLYVITPIPCGASPFVVGSNTLEQYRQQIRDGLSELADSQTQLIEGTIFLASGITKLVDNIHPGNAGAAEMAMNISPLISL